MTRQPDIAFNPFTGYLVPKTAGRDPETWRVCSSDPWKFNPWTGSRRHFGDVESDPQGRAIWEPEWGAPAAATPLQFDDQGRGFRPLPKPPGPQASYVAFGSLTLEVHNLKDIDALRTAQRFLAVLIEEAQRERG